MSGASCLVIVALAGCEMSPPPPGVTAMTAEGFTFGGKQVALPATIAQLKDMFGEPDRIVEKANRILVWDGRGIYAYCQPDRDEIHDISIAFQGRGFDFDPQNPFTGAVAIEGALISPRTTLAELRSAGFTGDPELSLEKQFGERFVLVEFDGWLWG